MNVLDAHRVDGVLRLGSLKVPVSSEGAAAVAGQSSDMFGVGIRPEHFTVASEGLAGEVSVVEALGSESFVHVRIAHEGEEQLIVARVDGQSEVNRGDTITLAIDGPAHVFGDDGLRISTV